MLPVAVFAYNRPDHLARCLEALEKERDEVNEIGVIVFSDGPRSAKDAELVELVRKTAKKFEKRLELDLRIRKENYGLRRSIESGVSSIVEEFGKVVVVEDDLILLPGALRYFEAALERYEKAENVFQVSGFQFPQDLPGKSSVGFLPITTSWGWATWRRAWKDYSVIPSGDLLPWSTSKERSSFDFGDSYPYSIMLEASIKGEIDSWAIHWYASVYRRGGLTCYPSRSLVRNEGFDGSGTHCGTRDEVQRGGDESKPFRLLWPDEVGETVEWSSRVQAFLKSQREDSSTDLAKSSFRRYFIQFSSWLRKIRSKFSRSPF